MQPWRWPEPEQAAATIVRCASSRGACGALCLGEPRSTAVYIRISYVLEYIILQVMAGDRVNAPSSSSAYLIIHISIVDGSAAGVDVARLAGAVCAAGAGAPTPGFCAAAKCSFRPPPQRLATPAAASMSRRINANDVLIDPSIPRLHSVATCRCQQQGS